MNKLFFLVVFCLLITAISCNQVYKKWEKESFSTLSWKPEKALKFYPEIDDTTKTYELTLGVRHMFGSRLDRVALIVTTVSPSGKEQVKNYTLTLKDEAGNALASCAGNMCDLESVVNPSLKFSEPGKYAFIITPDPASGNIVGIMEFGFILSVKD
jgi:gliding motility-associated lipoprotein GldH